MLPIRDYAIIGDTHTAALVGRDGSIDWLCIPRFDSAACFASLLGGRERGRWRIAPDGEIRKVERRYRGPTMVLETVFETSSGEVCLIDFMPICAQDDRNDLVRLVRGVRGSVRMIVDLVVRFDYGIVVPWILPRSYGVTMISGPDALQLHTPVELKRKDHGMHAEFEISAGDEVPFHMTWFPSHVSEPPRADDENLLSATEAWWQDWVDRCRYEGPWRDLVIRSLLTLKALTYGPSGATVAAPTTSLPEKIGGIRNWDYRICWLRDSTFLLYALLSSGFPDEAQAWRAWLMRAVAGEPLQLQIMYGVLGERRLTEHEVPELSGYFDSKPVRIGNAAHTQFQLDVYGEVMDSLYFGRKMNVPPDEEVWEMQLMLLNDLERRWREPDNGIWEVRGPRQHFTHSKMMAWVAFDRAIKTAERFGRDVNSRRWQALRTEIHQEICTKGFNSERNAFVQAYGSKHLDASLLMMPLVGFLPATDSRMLGTIDAIAQELAVEGLVRRYETETPVDGLPPGEGVFLPCSFWLVDCLTMAGRVEEAKRIFDRLSKLPNDVGLLSEEYDPIERQFLGNFPQAMTHVGLINTVYNLSTACGPAEQRSSD